MAKKLYVGNLSYDTTEEGLHAAFAEVGQVESATIVTDRMSGRSRGFGFVEMATEEAAKEAISALNGKMLDGRELNVAEARPPRSRDDRGGRGQRGGGRRDRDSRGYG
jgi:RNA recognition motif-containing protein